MFSFNLFKKTLSEQKISLAIYTISLGLYAWMMVAIYPSTTKGIDIDQYWESFPDVMKQLFGGQELSFATLEGFISIEYILIWQFIIIAFAIAFATRSIAKEIEDGTLELILSYPISRLKFIFTKIATGAIAIFLLTAISSLVLYLTTFTIDYSIALSKIIYIGIANFGLFFAFLGISFVFSAIFSERSRASFTIVGILIASYLLNAFSTLSDKVEKFDFISLFKYVENVAILKNNSINWSNFGILIGVGVIGSIISIIIFKKRDI